MPQDRNAVVTQARQRIQQLRTQYNTLRQEAQSNPQAAERNRQAVNQQLNALTEQIQRIETLIANAGSIADLLSAMATGNVREVASQAVATGIDLYLSRFPDGKIGERTLLDTGNRRITVPVVSPFNVVFSFSASLKGEATVQRKSNTLEGQIKISGHAAVGVGISVGFDVPILGNLSIGGGIEGGPTLEGTTTLKLTAAASELSAELTPGNLKIDMVASLYFDMPSVVPDSLIEWIVGHSGIEALSSRGDRILIRLGSINIFELTTPTYKLTLSTSNWTFSGGRSEGNYSARLNPVVERKLTAFKNAVVNGANAVLRSLNPANWF